MYTVKPQAVYVHERVLEDPAAAARMERMVGAMDLGGEPEVVDDARLSEISLQRQWPQRANWRTGQWRLSGGPVIVFNCFTFEPQEAIARRVQRYPGLRPWLLHGGSPWTFRSGRKYYRERGTVCQDAWELHSAFGCLHRCAYCHIGEGFNIMVNLEELVRRLPALLEANEWLQLYKYDNMTDTITLEPEYGASQLMVDFFARQRDRWLMLYTKSNNVDHLLDLEPRGQTIVSFTISCPTVAAQIEKGTPSTAERIEAAAKIQQAGYIPRVRFSPIVPIKGWHEENAAMIRDLFEAVEPDIITMDLLGWMNPHAAEEIIDPDLLDERFVDGMRRLFADGPPGPAYYPTSKHIFPHALRLEVYKFVIAEIRRWSRRTVVSLCNETVEMWDELGPALGMTPNNYVCGCGPTSVPSNPLLARRRQA